MTYAMFCATVVIIQVLNIYMAMRRDERIDSLLEGMRKENHKLTAALLAKEGQTVPSSIYMDQEQTADPLEQADRLGQRFKPLGL